MMATASTEIMLRLVRFASPVSWARCCHRWGRGAERASALASVSQSRNVSAMVVILISRTMGAAKVDDRGGEPSLFGGPGEVVRSERLPRIWKVSGRITGDQGIQESADESSVAATVTRQPLWHVDGRDPDALASTGAELK